MQPPQVTQQKQRLIRRVKKELAHEFKDELDDILLTYLKDLILDNLYKVSSGKDLSDVVGSILLSYDLVEDEDEAETTCIRLFERVTGSPSTSDSSSGGEDEGNGDGDLGFVTVTSSRSRVRSSSPPPSSPSSSSPSSSLYGPSTSSIALVSGAGSDPDRDPDSISLPRLHQPITIASSNTNTLTDEDKLLAANGVYASTSISGSGVTSTSELRPLKEDIEADMARIEAEAAEDDETIGEGCCEMCEREMKLTAHHLIPQEMHKRYKKKGYSTAFLNTCALICRPCHSAVHRMADNKTLAAEFHTIELLMETEFIQNWVAYASKQIVRSSRSERNDSVWRGSALVQKE